VEIFGLIRVRVIPLRGEGGDLGNPQITVDVLNNSSTVRLTKRHKLNVFSMSGFFTYYLPHYKRI
jgi:hypothetical protein